MDERTPKTTGGALAFCALASLALLLATGVGCRAVATGRNVDGVRYFQQGQFPVALQRFDAALAMDPKNPDSYYNKGALLHRTGVANRDQASLTQAESLYRQCLDYNPDHIDCHRGLAVLLTETGRVPQGFELLKGWATRSPQNADARVELARLYEEYGDPRSAEVYLNESLAVAPSNWRAHAALGRLKEQSGDLPQAIANYERSYNLNRFQPQLATRIETLRTKAPAAAATTLAGSAAPMGSTRTATAPRGFRTY